MSFGDGKPTVNTPGFKSGPLAPVGIGEHTETNKFLVRLREMFRRLTPNDVLMFHEHSDRDKSVKAQHHTLGSGATQAAPGTAMITLAEQETRIAELEEQVALLTTMIEELTLNDLADVFITTPIDGEHLVYDGSPTFGWINF